MIDRKIDRQTNRWTGRRRGGENLYIVRENENERGSKYGRMLIKVESR